MKTKECKVTYVDDLKTDYKVECAEIMCKYRIYAKGRTGGYDLVVIKHDEQKAKDYAKNIHEDYENVLVIEHNPVTNTDTPIDLGR